MGVKERRARHHMTEIEQFALLVGEIYDAALERTRWPDVLRQVSGYVNGCAASLMSHDLIEQNASFFYTWNDNPEYTRSYAEKYAKLNPAIVPATIQSKIGDVSTIYDFVPMDEFLASQIYREWSASAHARSATGKHFLNLYDGSDWDGKSNVGVNMTMTSPACPAGPQLLSQSKDVVSRLDGVSEFLQREPFHFLQQNQATLFFGNLRQKL